MRLLLHGVACAILLILLYKIGQLRQIRANNEQIKTLIQNNLVESLLIHQTYCLDLLHFGGKKVEAYNIPYMVNCFSQLMQQKNQIDSLMPIIISFRNDSNKLVQGYDSVFQIHKRMNKLFGHIASPDIYFEPFVPVITSDQVQWKVGQPETLQLLLTSNDPHKYFQEVPISINHHPVKNNKYQQRFNASGTHPLHIRYQHPKTLDSMSLTYFVNVQQLSF